MPCALVFAVLAADKAELALLLADTTILFVLIALINALLPTKLVMLISFAVIVPATKWSAVIVLFVITEPFTVVVTRFPDES